MIGIRNSKLYQYLSSIAKDLIQQVNNDWRRI